MTRDTLPKTRYVLMNVDVPEAVFRTEDEADKVADFLNEAHHQPYWVAEATPSPEVVAAFTRLQKTWRSADGELHDVRNMNVNHLTNAAHLCLTWQERFGAPMNGERRAMCQNVRDEVVRRRVFEVGK